MHLKNLAINHHLIGGLDCTAQESHLVVVLKKVVMSLILKNHQREWGLVGEI